MIHVVATKAGSGRFVGSLDEASLQSLLRYKTSQGTPCEHPLCWAVTHFFNHQTHHRGQMTTLLNQLGVDPGVTDFIAFVRTHKSLDPSRQD